MLNRDDRTIWTCYNRANKKAPAEPEKAEKELAIPLEILKDRSLAPLEAISEFLKDQKNMSYHEIAELLNRDDRTIWTCYMRAKKKRGGASS